MTGATVRDRIAAADFRQFKEFVHDRLQLPASPGDVLADCGPQQIYAVLQAVGVPASSVAQLIAEYLNLDYLAAPSTAEVEPNVLSEAFIRRNFVVAITDGAGGRSYALTNPFNWELLSALKKNSESEDFSVVVTAPESIEALLNERLPSAGSPTASSPATGSTGSPTARLPAAPGEKGGPAEIIRWITPIGSVTLRPAEDSTAHDAVTPTDEMLQAAIKSRASDIHIEPKQERTVVRFRIDGEMREMFSFDKTTAAMVISRLKALAGLDIAQRNLPQDGALETTIADKKFKLRLATTSTPAGESLIIRLLEPEVCSWPLKDLGMTDLQVKTLVGLANRRQGLLLFVGPTGSGKTTSIYSLLSRMDLTKRSLISVEDPIEYRIPNANQQQVNEKMGLTFEAILKSSVRQDPDIMFIGEIRDSFSSRIAVDFASVGHITISTLHTSNATTAIFRLERLGVTRGQMADSIIGVIAQRLISKLCPNCKQVLPITEQEIEMFRPYTSEIPTHVAHAVGCPQCDGSGYLGREGIYEVIAIDPEIREMIRENRSIAEIRASISLRGDYLISHHAMEKVKQLQLEPETVYERVLVEEPPLQSKETVRPTPGKKPLQKTDQASDTASTDKPSILVIEDDKDTQAMIAHILENSGYLVTVADDGIDAMVQLSRSHFQLILSDVKMPNLDGFKFMEIKNQKGIKAPVIFLTGEVDTEAENKALELGAADFIRKPFEKNVLLLRIKRVLAQTNEVMSQG